MLSFEIRWKRSLTLAALLLSLAGTHQSFAAEPTEIEGYKTAAGAQASARPNPIPARYVYGAERDWVKQPYKLAVLLVEFSDRKHQEIHTAQSYDELMFSKDKYFKTPSGDPAHGSVADWYRGQSLGRFELTGKVFDWVTVDETFETIHGLKLAEAQKRYLKIALDKVRARDGADALQGFDGYMFVHVGPITGPSGNIFWSHRSNVERKRYVTTGEIETINVICHEFGHILGLPDMYAKKGQRESFGPWCTMASGYRGKFPKSFCVWSKTRLGWSQPTVIDATTPQKLVLRPIQSNPNDAFLIPLNAKDGAGADFLLLENRTATGNDEEGQAGLFIWHIVRTPESGNMAAFTLKLPGPDDKPGQNMNTRRVTFPTDTVNEFTIKLEEDGPTVDIHDIHKVGDQVFFEVGTK